MNIFYFEGAAGTGKTYSLIHSLKDYLREHTLAEHQRVLALTFMHGSRKRLEIKLYNVNEIKKKFECVTFDSFAWEIVQRWEGLLSKFSVDDYIIKNPYDKVCAQAAILLALPSVQKWISRTYPVVLIDEVQDLSKPRFEILRGLSEYCTLFVAGDAFQVLQENVDSLEFLRWLKDNSKYEYLTEVKRTDDNGILTVSSNLRSGTDFLGSLKEYRWGRCLGNFKLVIVPKWHLMAWQIGFDFHRYKYRQIAILVLSHSESIVEKALTRVRTETQRIKDNTFGPFPNIVKIINDEEYAQKCMLEIDMDDSHYEFEEVVKKCENISDQTVAVALQNWLRKRKRIGYSLYDEKDLYEKVLNIYRNQRIYRRTKEDKQQVLTIHQAKNREFEHVIIPWTFGMASNASDDYKRRLLYNAITRAVKSCTVILMQEDRLMTAPFTNSYRSAQ